MGWEDVVVVWGEREGFSQKLDVRDVDKLDVRDVDV
jgi:hypothetical protein